MTALSFTSLFLRDDKEHSRLVNSINQVFRRSGKAGIRIQVSTLEPNVLVSQALPLDDRLSKSITERRFQTHLLSVFAGTALIIAMVGIYSFLSYTVSRRTYEIGVRMALGAQAGDVLRMVIWRGMRLTFVGVTLGVASSFALTRVLKNLLVMMTSSIQRRWDVGRPHRFERCTIKPVTIGRLKPFARDAGRELYHQFCNIVGGVMTLP